MNKEYWKSNLEFFWKLFEAFVIACLLLHMFRHLGDLLTIKILKGYFGILWKIFEAIACALQVCIQHYMLHSHSWLCFKTVPFPCVGIQHQTCRWRCYATVPWWLKVPAHHDADHRSTLRALSTGSGGSAWPAGRFVVVSGAVDDFVYFFRCRKIYYQKTGKHIYIL